MAQQSRSDLEAYFVAGAEPTAAQFAELIENSVNLEDGGTVSGTTSFTGNAVGVDLTPSLSGLTATTQNTSGTTTGVVETLHVKNFTGLAAEAVTLPAATVGVRLAYVMSVDTTGGIETLSFDCAGSDAFATGQIIESRAANVVTYDTSTVGETLLTYTPANAVTNFVSQGSIFYFWCTTAAFWNVQLFAKANPASTGLTGACAFGS
jgi:hypothetical protein